MKNTNNYYDEVNRIVKAAEATRKPSNNKYDINKVHTAAGMNTISTYAEFTEEADNIFKSFFGNI